MTLRGGPEASLTSSVDRTARSQAAPAAAPETVSPADGPEGTRSDRELLEAHVAGDSGAFATLVGRHQDRMWAIALRVMRNPEDAADALQDAYISAFRRAGSFRGESLVTTWLHRVVVNACLDRLRVLKSRAAQPLPEDVDRTTMLPADPRLRPEEVVDAEHDRDVVTAALAQINTDQRAALVLVDMQGYSVDEAAAILGCAPGTVKSRCARGRAKLLPLLAGLRQPEEEQ